MAQGVSFPQNILVQCWPQLLFFFPRLCAFYSQRHPATMAPVGMVSLQLSHLSIPVSVSVIHSRCMMANSVQQEGGAVTPPLQSMAATTAQGGWGGEGCSVFSPKRITLNPKQVCCWHQRCPWRDSAGSPWLRAQHPARGGSWVSFAGLRPRHFTEAFNIHSLGGQSSFC